MIETAMETERLILREWREEDRDPFFALNSDPAVMEFLPAGTRADSDAAVERMIATQAEHGHCFWAVERKADGAFLGFCGLKVVNLPGTPVDGETEIGWRLREDAWGRGYAKEAAVAALAWGWANLDRDRILAFTVRANEPSRRLMQRLAMTRRADLDFAHPHFAPGHPLSEHITYVAERASR